MDAGGIFDFSYLLDLPIVQHKSLVIYTLARAGQLSAYDHVSYIHGDLRNTILRDDVFEEIACVSTLEHIGMDNAFLYTSDRRYQESRSGDYRQALVEFQRVLAPGGKLYLTLPYGRYQDCGWLQQFDRDMLDDVFRTFNGKLVSLTFYRYDNDEWAVADQESCDGCVYFDVHHADDPDADYAAAARAVVCAELQKR